MRASLPFACGFQSFALRSAAQDKAPTRDASVGELRAIIDATARANFEAACLAVTRDATQKKLRIYAIKSEAETGTVKCDDVEVEVVYHKDLAAENRNSAGAYHQHHNQQVLCFAASQFAEGKKALGLRLVKLLAEADPYLWWSSPDHPGLTIEKIVAGLEKDDETVRDFLKEQSKEWAYRVKYYGR